ncbi:hypothetical protein Poly30_10800 [Planctomycetes bacterium Poly30]|uniref:PDZ domain-containing protein n=1 Tax=Saltatorellus ferox TaxID=2528018 RepID=A0A518ENB6_9BACT|nr:hypothetical protein Poly30_10800 [Planctomycetes bacterium Poly30]
MRGIDLSRWTFDWDLTFAVLTVHPDGTVLHRYGGRDSREPDHWLTEASYRRFLTASLEAHRQHEPREIPTTSEEPITIDSIPSFAERDKGACIHCHSALPALRIEAQYLDTWTRDDLWVYPPPSKIGLDLDRDDQALITAVAPDSFAARAGLRSGDRLTSVATATDLMAVLNGLPNAATALALPFERADEAAPRLANVELPAGWKTYTPAEFAWRPSKWGLSPAPGFGGPVLNADQLAEVGLPAGTFAFEVDYLVTWGENQKVGKAAAAAGIHEGLIVLGTESKRDFLSIDHFHAWWRLSVSPGSTVRVAVWNAGAVEIIPIPISLR